MLADAGIVSTPTSAWPLSWGSVGSDLVDAADRDDLNVAQYAAMGRVKARLREETVTGEMVRTSTVTVAEQPTGIRDFNDTPRGGFEAKAELEYTGDRFAAKVEIGAVESDDVDDQDIRLDGSYLGIVIGNWMIAAGAQDRWWGPGWDSSLLLSTNARPIKAFSVQRNFPEPFKTKWLKWIGPWTTTLVWGQLEDGRGVPNARFFGWQIGFRPIPSLEIGLERTAQWCGSGRPCGFDTFTDLLIGQDNQGDEGVVRSEEPGNQLAGFSVRWASPVGSWPYALYAQLTGEDEAGDLPSKFLGLFGFELWGRFRDAWNYRLYAEAADTTCSFFDRPGEFNCAYNNGLYPTGYRYRGRSIGHSAEQDARLATLGVVAVNDNGREWQGAIKYAELNRGGAPDPRNTLAATPKKLVNIEVKHRRVTRWGRFDFGAGVERVEDEISGSTNNDARAFVRWRREF